MGSATAEPGLGFPYEPNAARPRLSEQTGLPSGI